MDLIEQILKQAKSFLVCPICNNPYQSGEIKFRGFVDNTYIFQGCCAKGHEPLAVTYLASLSQIGKPISAYFHALSGKKITPELSDLAQSEIDRFDSDFKKLWN